MPMWEEKGKGTSFQGERTLSDESPALERAAGWGSPSSLLGLCLLIPKCKLWPPRPLCWMSAWGEGKSLGSIVFFPSWWGYRSQNGSLMTFVTEKVPGVRPWAKPTSPFNGEGTQPPHLSTHSRAPKQKTVRLWGIMKTKMWIIFFCSYWLCPVNLR